MPLNYWDEAFFAATYLSTISLAKPYKTLVLLKFYFMRNLITPCLGSLVALVGRIFVHIILAN
jgi:hypothetical protein